MTPGIALLVIGGILLVSGWKGSSIVDTFAGNFPAKGNGSNASNGTSAPADIPGGAKGYGNIQSGLHYAGPDQGIDFTGKGSIFAPVDLLITKVDMNSGWPGGHLIVGKILGNHPPGRGYIYFAEALNPSPGIRVGARVGAGARIATLDSSYPGTEIGFAQDASGRAFGTTKDGKAGGPAPTFGRQFLAWLLSLRTPKPSNRLDNYPR